MATVWLDVGGLVLSSLGPKDVAQAEHARLALALEPGLFGFCCLDSHARFVAVSALATLEALNPASGSHAPAPLAGYRQRVQRLISRLPPAIQPAVTAFARGALHLVRPPKQPAVQTPAGTPQPNAPFGANNVFLSLRSTWAPDDLALLHSLRQQIGFRMMLPGCGEPHANASAIETWAHREAHRVPDASQTLRCALVLASQGGTGFEDRLQHLYMALLQPGDLCIDIGAHTARHTLPMSCAIGAAGTVEAFEPNPAISALLQTRMKSLAVSNVRIHEMALSDESGMAEFVIAVDLPEESGLRERSVYNGQTRTEKVTVQLERLDSFDFTNPRFIKLDTEGAEYKVLLGARGTLSRWRPVVAFEFGEASYAAYGVDPCNVFDYFASMGYAVISIHGEVLSRDAFVVASRVQRYWDYVACDCARSEEVVSVLQSFTMR